jgi:hypothetical protein
VFVRIPTHLTAAMYSFKLSQLIITSNEWSTDSSDFGETNSLKNIYKLKSTLNKTKTKLDDIYKLPLAGKIMRSFDPFTKTKYIIAKNSNAMNVTNAWLKGYELFYQHNLIPRTESPIDSFVYFDNASFPGSFILAANHIVHTVSNIKNFSWHASSLLEDTYNSKRPLGDSYKLFMNYPRNWLMNQHNNGDIVERRNITDFKKQFKTEYGQEHAVNLYSCDLGTDVSSNYNAQEEIHFILNLGQIVCGLEMLKSGGNMVIKHYTIFEPFTISYIALLTHLFQSVEICKPLSSKRTNSELYIVCKGYKYPFKPDSSEEHVYNILIGRLTTKDTTYIIPSKYIKQQIIDIETAVTNIYIKQIHSLNLFIYCVTHILNKQCNKKLNRINYQIRKKFDQMEVKYIKNEYNLTMVKKY